MPQSIFGLPGSGNPDTVPRHADWQLSQYEDTWIYDKAGTYYWTKPDGVEFVMFKLLGGGSGGGSGRKGAAGTARGAGGGGGGSGMHFFSVEAAALPSVLEIIVGAGGDGGTAVSANSTDGNNGANGGTTSIFSSPHAGGSAPYLLCRCEGGLSGTNRGTTATPTSSSLSTSQAQAGWTTNRAWGGNLGGFGERILADNTTQIPRAGVQQWIPVPMLAQLSTWSFNGGAGGRVGSPGFSGSAGSGGGGGGAGTNDVINSGAGGRGGDGVVVIQAFGRNPKCNLQVFNSNSIWEKPSDPSFTMAYIVCFGAGGGGGSGRLGATSTYRGGGAGGAGGSVAFMYVPLSMLPNRIDVTIGRGGAGGAAVTTNDTNGNPGSNGEFTSFGTIVYGHPGLGGAGGSNALVQVRGGPNSPYEALGATAIATSLSNAGGGVSENLTSGGDYLGTPCVGKGGGGISATNVNGGISGRARQVQWNSASVLHEPSYANSQLYVPFNSPEFGGYYCSASVANASPSVGIDGLNGRRGNGGGGGAGQTNGSTSGAGGSGGNGQITVLCF